MSANEIKTAPKSSSWDTLISTVADVPWGVIAFGVVLGLNTSGHLSNDALTGLGSAAGLLGVSHGIHLGAKHLAGRRR